MRARNDGAQLTPPFRVSTSIMNDGQKCHYGWAATTEQSRRPSFFIGFSGDSGGMRSFVRSLTADNAPKATVSLVVAVGRTLRSDPTDGLIDSLTHYTTSQYRESDLRA